MSSYCLVNTNETYRPWSKDFMLANKCVVAQYNSKVQIASIQCGDIVFVYQNGAGIIAHGTATGDLEIKDFEGRTNEQFLMRLTSLQMVDPPIPPSTITDISKEVTKQGIYYARTVQFLAPELGDALYQLATESKDDA